LRHQGADAWIPLGPAQHRADENEKHSCVMNITPVTADLVLVPAPQGQRRSHTTRTDTMDGEKWRDTRGAVGRPVHAWCWCHGETEIGVSRNTKGGRAGREIWPLVYSSKLVLSGRSRRDAAIHEYAPSD